MTKLKQILLISCLLFSLATKAQTVSYLYRALAAEGCKVYYSIVKEDSAYAIDVRVRSDRLVFLSNPTMKIKTFNGTYMDLSGTVIRNGEGNRFYVVGGIPVPVQELITLARFAITPQQMETLKEGVAKIYLSMAPMNHVRTFRKDKIGRKLYQFYLEKAKGEDGF